MGFRAMKIKIDDLSGTEIVGLLREHLQGLAEVSVPESMHALDLDDLRQHDVTFWSVWHGNELAGCEALKELNATHAEIKSMRTAKVHLRNGVATMLLEHIVQEAKRRGYRKLSLETGANEAFKPARACTLNSGSEVARHSRITLKTRTAHL